MSFFGSLRRFLSSLFGLAEGKTERATDALVSSSADSIRAQFRKTREDWTRDYTQMREAVADLIRIREMKMDEVKRLNRDSDELEQKMEGAIALFKKTPDERYRQAFGQLANQNEVAEKRIAELLVEIDEQQKAIERYKSKLMDQQRQIEVLGKEEAETVADIVSSQKIRELNDRLSGISVDSQSKNLEAIRTARQKAKSVAKLSSELSGSETSDLDKQLKAAGAGTKFLSGFDNAVTGGKITATEDIQSLNAPQGAASPISRPGGAKDSVESELENLMKGTNKGL